MCSTAAGIERHFARTLFGPFRVIFWPNVGCHKRIAGNFIKNILTLQRRQFLGVLEDFALVCAQLQLELKDTLQGHCLGPSESYSGQMSDATSELNALSSKKLLSSQ
jgi:hypothetical protein